MYPNDPNQMNDPMNNLNSGNNPKQSWFEEFPDPNAQNQAPGYPQTPQQYAEQAPYYPQAPQQYANQAPGYPQAPQQYAEQAPYYPQAPQQYANQAPYYPQAPQQYAEQAPGYPQAPQQYAEQAPGYPQAPQQYAEQAPYYPQAPQQYAEQVPGYPQAPVYPQFQQAPVNAGVPEIQDFASFQQEIDAQGIQPVQPAYGYPAQNTNYQQPQAPQYDASQPQAPQYDASQYDASQSWQQEDDDEDFCEEEEEGKKKGKKKLFYILFPTILAVIAALMAVFLFVIMPKLNDDSDEKMTRRNRDDDYETSDPDETDDTEDTDDTEETDDTDETEDPSQTTDATSSDPSDTDPSVTRNTSINGVTSSSQITPEQMTELQDLSKSHLEADVNSQSKVEMYSSQFLGTLIVSKTMPEGDIRSCVYLFYQVIVKDKATGEYVEYFWYDGVFGVNDDGSMDLEGGAWVNEEFTHGGWTVRGCSTLDSARSVAEKALQSGGYAKSDEHIDAHLIQPLPENPAPADRAGFIFPTIDTEEIPDDKIAALTTDEIRVAINDICALHGVKFSKPENQTKYKQYPWYKETISMDEFNGNPGKFITNPIEKKNFDKLVKERQKRGGNGA